MWRLIMRFFSLQSAISASKNSQRAAVSRKVASITWGEGEEEEEGEEVGDGPFNMVAEENFSGEDYYEDYEL